MDFRNFIVIIGVVLPLASCVVQSGADNAESDEHVSLGLVDATELKVARENQKTAEASGLVFDGRVWLTPQAHVSFYHDSAGGHLNMPVVPGTKEGMALLLAHRVSATQSVEDYVASFEHVHRPADSTQDIFVFDPSASQAGSVASTRSALSNESCPINDFNSVCATPLRWHGKSALGFWEIDNEATRWAFFDQTSYLSQDWFSITNMTAAVCADNGPAKLNYEQLKVDGTLISKTTFTANPGTLALINREYGYSWRDKCISSILGICTSWRSDVSFNTGPRTRVSAQYGLDLVIGGGNFHFCGYFGGMAPYTYKNSKGPCQRDECPHADFNQAQYP